MKTIYQKDDIILKILNETYTPDVLGFYSENRDYFDIYETDKPSNFYTYSFIHTLLNIEYNSFVKGKNIRYFLYSQKLAGDKIIGSISFTSINRTLSSCEIGYKIDHNYQHLGLGTAMLKLAKEDILKDLNIHRVQIHILPDNTASIKLAEKSGFRFEGQEYSLAKINHEWHDHLRYSLITDYVD